MIITLLKLIVPIDEYEDQLPVTRLLGSKFIVFNLNIIQKQEKE